MRLLAYIDIRPFFFIGGLPLFVGLSLLVCRAAKTKLKKAKVAFLSAILFTGFFTLFLTGFGPFVDQKETRDYLMTWEIRPNPSNGMKESEIVLRFVDFPGHFIGNHSDELASHLRESGQQPVKVVFKVTSDYGRVRGFHATEIAGLREWKSEWGYSGSSGVLSKSPWD
jgi:hypothetical protein